MEKWITSREIRDLMKISSQHLYELTKSGKIQTKKISEKKYLYLLPENFLPPRKSVIYARVSTSKQMKDLENQIDILKIFILTKGIILEQDSIYKDIASGMNENRAGLQKLLCDVKDGKIDTIFITRKDRLTRFGFGHIQYICSLYQTQIVTIDETEDKTFEEELTQDLISIIHHFSMKMYGKRRNTLKKCKEELEAQ